MSRKALRCTAWTLVLALLFGQVGLNLMHTHQGQPGKSLLALSASADSGAAKCKACAIDGMPVLYVEPASTIVFEFVAESFATQHSGDLELTSSSALHGRAPPVY